MKYLAVIANLVVMAVDEVLQDKTLTDIVVPLEGKHILQRG
jgi:hypothetical protein